MTREMGHLVLFGVLVLVFVNMFPIAPTASAEPANATIVGVAFSQVDFYFNGSLIQANSEWGEFNIEFIPGDHIELINVIANTSGPNQWIIRNLPLFPSSMDPSQLVFSTYFDLSLLGVTRGTQLANLNYWLNQSVLPVSSAPVHMPDHAASVSDSSAITNSGVPSGVTALGLPPAADVFSFTDPFVNVQIYWHKGMPNCVQGKNQCGPGSATNSLHWLAQEHDWSLKNTNIQASLEELVTDMKCDNTGTWDDAFADGKLAFAQRHDLPLQNHYAGGEKLPKAGDYKGIRRDGDATWNYVEQELDKGQDVEIMTSTHWVVLSGKISWNSVHMVEYRDDPYQHGGATTDEEKAEIAKRHKFTYMKEVGGKLHTNIGNGDEEVLTVFSESPAIVGGDFVPVDKFGLLTPHIGFASAILAVAIAATVYVKRVKRRKEKQ